MEWHAAFCGQRAADPRSYLAIVDPDLDHVADHREFGKIGQYRPLDASRQLDMDVEDFGHVTRPPAPMMNPPAVFRRGLLSHAPTSYKRPATIRGRLPGTASWSDRTAAGQGAGGRRAYPSLIHPAVSAFPERVRRVGLHIVLFEACSAFTRVAACTLARSPMRDPLS